MAGLFAPDRPAALVRVAPERAVDHPEGLVYEAVGELRDVGVGERVYVPLGRGDALAAGVVVEVGVRAEIDPARIKPVARRAGLRLPETLVELGRWIAQYYCAPLGVALAAMAPAAVKKGVGRRRRRVVAPSGAEPAAPLPPQTRAAWEAIARLPAETFPIEPRALADRLGLRSVAAVNRLVKLGLLAEQEQAYVSAAWRDSDRRSRLGVAGGKPAVELTEEQERAVRAVARTMGGFAAHLLFGVTASGKTEVYLRLIEQVVAQGKAALVLAPEISLTPQLRARFAAALPDVEIATLHSGLTAAQRHEQWRAVAEGRCAVALGARSAVFAPFPPGRLGLIVVDEEHDGAYKQDEAPRFHARDVALKRGQIEGCPVVLGSATPSLESWRNALQKRHMLHELRERAPGMRLPTATIVSMQEERRRLRAMGEPRSSVIGPTLARALRATLDEGGQAIVLMNRRGYAVCVACPDHVCGWVKTCERCDAAMALHHVERLGGVMRCHHCQAEQVVPSRCPVCSRKLAVVGAGSQRVEAELLRRFPDLALGETLVRVDSDALRAGRSIAQTLERFAAGAIRVLLGTQMIGKGLDFPNVRLVGVVSADTALALPDFRAAERTFQLVAQVAGRAGRSDGPPARVVIQTLNPDEPAITLAAKGDYRAFASRELALRAEADLPPVSRMVRFVVRHRDRHVALERARRLRDAIAAHGRSLAASERLKIRGPFPCPLSRIEDRRRIAIEITTATAQAAQRLLAALRSAGAVHADASLVVDVDPLTLL